MAHTDGLDNFPAPQNYGPDAGAGCNRIYNYDTMTSRCILWDGDLTDNTITVDSAWSVTAGDEVGYVGWDDIGAVDASW